MKAKIITLDGKFTEGKASLGKEVFGLYSGGDDDSSANYTGILHRVVNWQLAKRQAGTHKTKERGEIRGSSRKLFKQKGTGNARTGNAKAPHKRSGGTAFGPRVRSHAHCLPKKIRALGLRIALSSKQNNNKIFVLKDNELKDVKTSALAKGFKALGVKSALILGGEKIDENLKNAVANIREVDLLPVQGANVYDILRRDNLILTEDAIKKLEERFNG